jgi:hypothetical protein
VPAAEIVPAVTAVTSDKAAIKISPNNFFMEKIIPVIK